MYSLIDVYLFLLYKIISFQVRKKIIDIQIDEYMIKVINRQIDGKIKLKFINAIRHIYDLIFCPREKDLKLFD